MPRRPSTAPVSVVPRGSCRGAWAAGLCALACTTVRADDAIVPVPATIPGTAVAAERPRVDPVRPARLSAAERDRLYGEVAIGAEALERQGAQLRRLTQLLRPTVVHIDTRKPALRPRGGKASEDEAGSGVIVRVAARTVVITNRHVVNRAELDNITIRLDDGRELTPRRLWSDAGTDIAVLEIVGDDLEPARLAAADTVDIGDMVLAIGSPFGLSHSVTLGIVSAKGRRDLELGSEGVRFQDFIQTDAAINPGNSGGPLVNLRGEVVGLNTAIASNSGGSEGIGFAIPVAMVEFVARQLVENGAVARGYLGVALDQAFSRQNAERLGMVRAVGARVTGVTPGSPADLAGIRADDVLVEFAGTPIDDDDHLVSMVSTTPSDREVEVVVFRDRQRVPLRIRVASRAQYETR